MRGSKTAPPSPPPTTLYHWRHFLTHLLRIHRELGLARIADLFCYVGASRTPKSIQLRSSNPSPKARPHESALNYSERAAQRIAPAPLSGSSTSTFRVKGGGGYIYR